jgi:hypothetical protein
MTNRPLDRRLRAALPALLAGLLAAGARWLEPPELTALLVVGLLGTVAVYLADRRTGLTAWRRRFPRLCFRGVRRFPREARGVRELDRMCLVTSAVFDELAEVGAPTRPERRQRARVQRRLDELVAMGASLTVHREVVLRSPEPDGQLLAAVERQIEQLVPAVLQLRATLLQRAAVRLPDREALSDLVEFEGDLRANNDCERELALLEASWTRAS